MTDEEFKHLTDRARVVQSYIDAERNRVLDLMRAIDGREFLAYCIENSWTVAEIPRAQQLFDQQPDPIPAAEQMIDDASQRIPPEIDQDIEDLM